MKFRRLLTRALAGVAAAVVGAVLVLVSASPAAAACSGKACNGLDPNDHCTATSTPGERFYSSYTVQLRYSAGCNAYWGRGMQDCYTSPPAYVRVERAQNLSGVWVRMSAYYSEQLPCYGNPAWTPMIGFNGMSRFRACIGSAGYVGDPPQTFPESYWSWCTQWVYT